MRKCREERKKQGAESRRWQTVFRRFSWSCKAQTPESHKSFTVSHSLHWTAKQKDNIKCICFTVPKLNEKVWLGEGPEEKNRQAFSAQSFCLEPSARPVWSHSTTFVTFRSYFRIRGLVGHSVAEKLLSLCSKETENSAGAKWPCDFKEALASNLSPSLVVKVWRNSSIKCELQKP